jgi:hypothetical protein
VHVEIDWLNALRQSLPIFTIGEVRFSCDLNDCKSSCLHFSAVICDVCQYDLVQQCDCWEKIEDALSFGQPHGSVCGFKVRVCNGPQFIA